MKLVQAITEPKYKTYWVTDGQHVVAFFDTPSLFDFLKEILMDMRNLEKLEIQIKYLTRKEMDSLPEFEG